MVGGSKKPRVSNLSCELDQTINRLLRDYAVKQQSGNGGGAVVFPGTAVLVEHVRREKIGLQRKSVLQLEKSIERVLPVLAQQLERDSVASASTPVLSSGAAYAHSSDEEPDFDESMRFDGLEAVPTMEVKDNNAMNGSLMRLWATRTENLAGANRASSPLTSKKPGGGGAAPARGSGTATPATLDREGHEMSTPTTSAGDKRRTLDASEAKPDETGKDKDAKRRKRPKGSADHARHAPPETRLSSLGGVDSCIEEVLELIVMPLKHPEIYLHTGVQPPRGVLLHGPPGCGKTLLANAIAGEVGVPFLQISAPSIVSGMSGESEKKLREVFEEARDLAPCIIFIDEIDAITPKRENAQREMERRIVAQMLTCIDDLSWEKTGNKPVMLIGATNRPDSLDPALRRAGRFDREIAMP
ncbi:Ribosome biogenesis ATPase rix7, partial [Coemansia sp. RSA 1836]